jgi:hypothetical protein
MAGGTETFIGRRIETMILDKGGGVAEGVKRLQGAFLLIFVTFGATDLLADSQGLGMGGRQTGNGLHLGTGGKYHDQPG